MPFTAAAPVVVSGTLPKALVRACLCARMSGVRYCKKCKATFEGDSCAGNHANFMCESTREPRGPLDLSGRAEGHIASRDS